jgi:predicted nucleic acid-binding protein
LVDPSVWIDHVRASDVTLAQLIEGERVVTHEMVSGEIACGSMRNRESILGALGRMARIATVEHGVAMAPLERRGLWGRGLAWVGVSLLVSAESEGAGLWTRDRSVRAWSKACGVRLFDGVA